MTSIQTAATACSAWSTRTDAAASVQSSGAGGVHEPGDQPAGRASGGCCTARAGSPGRTGRPARRAAGCSRRGRTSSRRAPRRAAPSWTITRTSAEPRTRPGVSRAPSSLREPVTGPVVKLPHSASSGGGSCHTASRLERYLGHLAVGCARPPEGAAGNRDRHFDFDVCIVGGAGHVGFPLAVAFATRGLSRGDLRHQRAAVVEIMAGTGAVPRARRRTSRCARRWRGPRWSPRPTAPSVSRSEHVVIVVGTPVDQYLSPDPEAVPRAVGELLQDLRPGQLVVLRSTVFPGVTRRVEHLLAPLDGVDLAFCPERIAEGRAMTELFTLPQIVAARTDRAPAARGGAVRAASPRRVIDLAAGGGRARQALHELLALHQVRRGQPVLHDGQRPRARLRP